MNQLEMDLNLKMRKIILTTDFSNNRYQKKMDIVIMEILGVMGDLAKVRI